MNDKLKNTRRMRLAFVPALMACGLLLAACGGGSDDAGSAGRSGGGMEGMSGMEGMGGGAPAAAAQEFAFSGTIQQIDRTTGIVSVAGEAVPGWMMAMTMNYYLQPAEVLEGLEIGDRITATAHSGDFQHLYDVKVVETP